MVSSPICSQGRLGVRDLKQDGPSAVADPKEKDPVPPGSLNTVLRLYGVVVGAVLAFGSEAILFILLGYWIDGKLDCRPWLTVAGAVVGFVLGTYHFVTALRRLNRNP